MLKRIISMLLAVVLVFALAPAVAAEDDNAFIESLQKGIIPLSEGMTWDDLYTLFQVADDSEGKETTQKFFYILFAISQLYYEEITEDDLIEMYCSAYDEADLSDPDALYRNIFALLDRFSYYLTPEESQAFFDPNVNKGIGISMVVEDGVTVIDSVASGSSAEEAGILPGDIVISFNGYNLAGLGASSLSAIIATVPTDAPYLEVTVERDGQRADLTLERRDNRFNEYSLLEIPEKNLLFIDIDGFMYAETALGVIDALDEAWESGVRNVMIDLRGNSGGNLSVAAAIMSKFTPHSLVPLFYMGRLGVYNEIPFYSYGDGYDFHNVKILVDSATASAAEILSVCLRDMTGAEIIGSLTYGKGVAQNVLSFTDGSAIGVTSYVAYDVNAETYNEKGVTPTYTVQDELEQIGVPNDLPVFTVFDYENAVAGAENRAVKALERRLEFLGYLTSQAADGRWEEHTSLALTSFQTHAGLAVTGKMNEETYFSLMEAVEREGSLYYYTFTAYDWAIRRF